MLAAPCEIVDLGVVEYSEAYRVQLARVEARYRDEVPDTLLFVEHPHVITLGRRKSARDNVLQGTSAAGFGDSIPVVEVERGGDATYHGPGQLVCYPIIKLAENERDLIALLRKLEQAVIDTLAHYGITAGREEGINKTGVWVGGKKICSLGVACRRWVTFHGLALNVTTDLAHFGRINPCGFSAGIMTSMEEVGQTPPMSQLRKHLTSSLGRSLGRTPGPGSGTNA